ncbi:transcriptional regulator [Bifidobacterium sp. UTCIF-37]|nr:transcriptional regulator [Bifidobacterium sp. UTCIF-37]TPF90862.1 transcriptional regulator [Bifidobacterium sp. UTCIF-38]
MASYSQDELMSILSRLISGWENEVVEFKEANENYSTQDIGKYFSALSNEANLRQAESAWLIFGVKNKTHAIVGTFYGRNPERLQQLKMQITRDTEPRSSFREIHELDTPEGRVLMFEIPPAPIGMPVSWQGYFHGRSGESLVALSINKLDAIRGESSLNDWSAQTVPDASLGDLDPEAVQYARESFLKAHANRFDPEEVSGWSDREFLNRAHVTRDGAITRAALLLLGKEESVDKLPAGMYEMTWKLVGQESAYEHFGLPFMLTTTRLYSRIRNIQIRLLPPGTLLQQEVSKYDEQSVLEALHNCIAHQDYRRPARILVTEHPDRLTFDSCGSFFEGTPDDYVLGDKSPDRYRNPFLVRAMSELYMIDRMGYGIKRMNEVQAKRYLPLPDYDLSDPEKVRLTMYGGVVDPEYTRLLLSNTDLPLSDVLALDRVQKHMAIPNAAANRLRRRGLIEGRKPHLRVAPVVASATDTKADFIRAHSQDDMFYRRLVEQYLKTFGTATRSDINELLIPKFGEDLSDSEKQRKIDNLLTAMRRDGVIANIGSRRYSKWRIAGQSG